MKLNRRQFLQVGGAALALPFLAPSRSARAALRPGGPKRLVIFKTPQGTVLPQFAPQGTTQAWDFGYVTEPLARFRDRLVVVTGVDNVMPRFNEVGNAHFNANLTVMTGRPFLVQDETALSPAGPSIEQTVAEEIGGDRPFPRIDLAIGGPETRSGLHQPREAAFFWYGPNDPVPALNDPFKTLLRLFGDNTVSPEDAWALRARRATVLDSVLANFGRLRARLGRRDEARLQAHADKLIALERRLAAGIGECRPPEISTPPGYRYGLDDDVTAPLTNDILVQALSCELTRVATINFANGHAPEFPWLTAQNGGRPIVDLGLWENWHAVVHADYQPGMEIAYRWYFEVFADLLDKMAAAQDGDGDNLLDSSLVIYLSEYSSGRHWNNALPVVMAGNLGPDVPLGRWLDFLPRPAAELGGYDWSGVTTNQLWTSVRRAFGIEAQTFGHSDATLPTGPLPGLLG